MINTNTSIAKCNSDPACVYPAIWNGKCRQHLLDDEYPISLYDISHMNYSYSFNTVANWKLEGFTLTGGSNGRALWQSKLRVGYTRRGRPKRGKTVSTTIPQPVVRIKLPQDRLSITHKFTIDKTRCYVIVGLYPDGRPGEIFLKVDKVGSTEHGMADSFSCLFSMALQYGMPLKVIVDKFKHVSFAPAGITDSQSKDLRFADSIIDYVVRWMEMKFINGNGTVGHEFRGNQYIEKM